MKNVFELLTSLEPMHFHLNESILYACDEIKKNQEQTDNAKERELVIRIYMSHERKKNEECECEGKMKRYTRTHSK